MGEEMDQGARKTLPVFEDREHSRSLLTLTTLNVTKADVQFFPPSPVTHCFSSFSLPSLLGFFCGVSCLLQLHCLISSCIFFFLKPEIRN